MTLIGTPKPRVARDDLIDSVRLSDLIGQTVELKRDGDEWKGLCPFHEERTPSFTVSDEKRFYHCFGCGAHGTAIDWTCFTNGLNPQTDFIAATNILRGITTNNVVPIAKAPAKQKRKKIEWFPVPADVKTPDMALRLEEDGPKVSPILTWAYRNRDGQVIGHVARYVPAGKEKTIRTWIWASIDNLPPRWLVMRWPRPYPMYGMEKLNAPGAAGKRIVLVEGEKACDAAQLLMPDSITMSWPGGTDGVHYVDWEPVAGAEVFLVWPDADEVGAKARDVILREVKPMVGSAYTVEVGDMPVKGWDAADALQEGWSPGRVRNWMAEQMEDGLPRARPAPSERAAAIVKPAPPPETPPDETRTATPAAMMIEGEPEGFVDARHWKLQPWRHSLILGGEDNDRLIKCEHNAAVPLREAPELKGAIRYNTIRGACEIVRKLPWGDQPGEWRDEHLTRLCQWLNRVGYMMGADMMQDAIECVAREQPFNPIEDYLRSVVWDGTPRIDEWLPNYCGAVNTPIVRAFGSRWLISGVARGIKPGTQADCMLVLEGGEGTHKTSLLRALGGDYFSPLRGKIGASDGRAMTQSCSTWIIEFGELDGVTGSKREALFDFLSTTDETYRKAYRRNEERMLRTAIFAGTTNESEYLLHGLNRRFWPVWIEFIKIDELRRDRDQLWAEAVARYDAGAHWWIKNDETELQQSAAATAKVRQFSDEWEGVIYAWLESPERIVENRFTLIEITNNALLMPRDRLDKGMQMRLGRIMKNLGYVKRDARAKVGGNPPPVLKHWFRPGHEDDED